MFLVSCGREKEDILISLPPSFGNVKEVFDGVRNVRFKICENPKNCKEENVINIFVEKSAICPECFEIKKQGEDILLIGGGITGAIYGISYILQASGFRFYHPFFFSESNEIKKTNIVFDRVFEPKVELRGIHLHTLHPIEGLISFHFPGNFDEAKKIINWIALNFGNFVQYAPLGDIKNPQRFEEWSALNRKILDYAHKIGVRVGINIQIFSKSSFQNAYLLSNEDDFKIFELPFDVVNLSFGEFLGENPDLFVDKLNETFGKVKDRRPDIEVHATIHVGNFDNLWVEYRGERLLYYFLVKFANPEIIPIVHTVMYYNLFDSAGGAYNHEDFREHRDFLFEYIRAGKKVGYKPESAYWIAFDNSVPLYLPIYFVSRWLDIFNIMREGKLYAHIIFSSGWEWGYWLYDLSSMQMTFFGAPSTFQTFLDDFFSPDIPIGKVGIVQYDYLIRKKLAPYLSGQDFYIDLACESKVIFSQPCRLSFEEVMNMSDQEKEDFRKDVIDNIREFETELKDILDGFRAKPDPIYQEVEDGLKITYLRARFIRVLYEGILNGKYTEHLSEAENIISEARKVVENRYRRFFYPNPDILISNFDNPTIYKFGYLKQAHILCLWKRDIEEFKKAIGENSDIPSCIN